MKKLTSFFICVILTLSIPFSAFAQEFNTMNDMFLKWEEDGYPDYVCGVWSNDGSQDNLTVSLVEGEAGEKGRQEIIDSVKQSEKITFTTAKYSINELVSIEDDLYDKYQEFNVDSMIFTTDILEQKNCVELGLDLKNRTDEIDNLIAYCEQTYGDKVNIIQGEPGYDADMYDSLPPTEIGFAVEDNNNFIYLCVGVALIGCVLFAVTYSKKRAASATLVTTTDETVTPALTDSEIEIAIKTTPLKPSKDFDEKMLTYFSEHCN